MEQRINYPWLGTYETRCRHVEDDKNTLTAWLANKITTREAARRIAHNNNAPVLTDEAFIQVVGQLGWRKNRILNDN